MAILLLIGLLILGAFLVAFFKSVIWASRTPNASWLDYRGQFDQEHYSRKGEEQVPFRSNEIAQQLKELYVPQLMVKGLSRKEAEAQASAMIDHAGKMSREHGTDNLPSNYGDKLLAQEQSDASIGRMLAKLRREGAGDADIRMWWNMHDLERRMVEILEDIDNVAMYQHFTSRGLSGHDAIVELRRYRPNYGDPDDVSQGQGYDRPLPYELKDRVNNYVNRRTSTDVEGIRKEVKCFSSFNAFVRSKIAASEL